MQHVGNWWQFWLWQAVGAAAYMASQEIRAALLKINPLRITTHTGIALGPRNFQLETAVGQGSLQWEQHLVLSLSLHPSVYLLLAQGAGLGEPLLCPSAGATALPALAPALYPCATGCTGVCSLRALVLLQQFVLFLLPFTAITVRILFWHIVQLLDPPAPARGGLCWRSRGEQPWKQGRPDPLLAALQAPTTQCWWEPAAFCGTGRRVCQRELAINQGEGSVCVLDCADV